MAKVIKFSDAQVEQLAELFESQRVGIIQDVEKMINERFIEQEKKFDEKLKTLWDNIQYELSPIKSDIADIKQRLNHLERVEVADAESSLDEIETLKTRVAILESKIAQLEMV